MSRLSELLIAAGGQLRALRDEANKPVFTEVRAELDRFDLSDLLSDSTRAPTARVCFMRAKPVARSDAGYDLDVSVAIVVVAGRTGRPNPDFSSADLHALQLLDACSLSIMLDPYVGLGQLQAAELGDQLVAVSEQSNKHGIAIALMEVKWRLLDVAIGRPVIQAALETGRVPSPATQVAINDGEPEPPPLPETAP
ncbi:hypothetical protein [Bosea sp. BK604]|uniref:hypothetical protein n=1 Tax=Bosea sp. BK604 TaxID=2512180 RepID=UPI00104C4370|nr:hypothetical protein [Bosea sp. BK604]TCR70521.1 hypothetical protein EV560_101928 [Bosea sp. BK604]